MIPDLKRNRQCGDCTECCTGTLHADIYGKFMDRGRPCHYLNKGCTIYENRPQLCKDYRCEWLKDDSTIIPEWMQPNLSKVIITERIWGDRNQYTYWEIQESGQKIDSTVLNWVYMYVAANNMVANIQVDSRWYQIGPPEFVEHLRNQR